LGTTRLFGETSKSHEVPLDSPGNNSIVDSQAEGVWLALTQRSEFTAYRQEHGGDILQLAGDLESRAERIRAGAPARSSSGNAAPARSPPLIRVG